MSFRYTSGINKPGFNPLGAQTSVTTYQPYLYSWGRNNGGQLGLSNYTNYSSPKQVGTLTTWFKLAGGDQFSTSVKTDGTLWAWGSNSNGVLGDTTVLGRSAPTQIGTYSKWEQVSAGASHTIAIRQE